MVNRNLQNAMCHLDNYMRQQNGAVMSPADAEHYTHLYVIHRFLQDMFMLIEGTEDDDEAPTD